jgi:hypothetical protein
MNTRYYKVVKAQEVTPAGHVINGYQVKGNGWASIIYLTRKEARQAMMRHCWGE